MGASNSWSQNQTMNDWMRDVEKRIMHEERRPSVLPAEDLVGPGISAYTRKVDDWNSQGPVVNGYFNSYGGQVVNSPDDNLDWVGLVMADPEGHGFQQVWEYIENYDPDADVSEGVTGSPVTEPGSYTRTFITRDDGSRLYSPWVLVPNSGSIGIAGVVVEDENGSVVAAADRLDFVGAGVQASAGGANEAIITITGIPPDNSVTSAKIVDGTIATADLGDSQVTLGKMAPNSVDASKIVNGSVGNSELGADAVTTDKILDATIALTDLSATGTKDSTTFLRGDNTWAVPPAAAGTTVLIPQVQQFTTTGLSTWTKPANAVYVVVEVQGAGGGGGSAGAIATSGAHAIGGGGGAGAYIRRTFLASALSATQSVFVGQGGASIAGQVVAGSGEASWFIASGTMAANGGLGGQGYTTNTNSFGGTGGLGGLNTITGNDFVCVGGNGEPGYGDAGLGVSGSGGFSFMGGGGLHISASGVNVSTAGNNGRGYGSGGGGAATTGTTAAAKLGGTGANGIVIVTSYIATVL